MGYPYIDKGVPATWPLYKLRVRIARRFPKIYPLMWCDFRGVFK